MKKFIHVIFMTVGLMTMTPQSADAQFSGLLRTAVEKGTQVAKNKKAAKEYNALVETVNEAISNHDLRYFCAANRREELRRAAAAAEIDNSDMDYKVQKFLSDETDLNNTDYIASARGLLARSKAEADIPTSNYLLKCAKIQYSTELQKADPATFPQLQKLYDEIIAYENTFTNGRNKGAEILSPAVFTEEITTQKEEAKALEYDTIDWSKVSYTISTPSSSSSDAKGSGKLSGEYPDLYTRSYEWKENGNVIASVAFDGTVKGGGRTVCQITRNGEIHVSGNLWGQVMKDGGKFVIYQYNGDGEPRRRGSVDTYSYGRVEWEGSTMGEADRIRDKSGNKTNLYENGNTHLVHRAVAFFLYDKIRR